MATLTPTNNPWQLVDQNNNVLAKVDPSGNATFAGTVSATGGTGGNQTVNGNQTVTGNQTVNGTLSANGTVYNTVRISATPADLLAIKATPKQIIAAPGALFSIQILGVSYKYKFVTTAYTLNAGTLKLFQGPVANAIPIHASVATGLIDQGADTDNINVAILASGAKAKAQLENVAINLANDGAAEFTLGDGIVEVTVVYAVIPWA